jgi:hypothetical protein
MAGATRSSRARFSRRLIARPTNFVAASMTMPATASSMDSSLSLLLELLELLVGRLLLDHRLGRRCPLYPGGGPESA